MVRMNTGFPFVLRNIFIFLYFESYKYLYSFNFIVILHIIAGE